MTIFETNLRTLTAASVTAEATRALRAGGIESAARDSRLLVAAALGIDAARLLSRPEMPVEPGDQSLLKFFARRVAGTRFAHSRQPRFYGGYSTFRRRNGSRTWSVKP